MFARKNAFNIYFSELVRESLEISLSVDIERWMRQNAEGLEDDEKNA